MLCVSWKILINIAVGDRKITLCDGDELNHNIEAIISIRINLTKYLDENELIYFFDWWN